MNIRQRLGQQNMHENKASILGAIGTHMDKYTDRKGEVATLFDRRNINESIKNRYSNLGDQTFYAQYYDANGEPIKGAILRDEEGEAILPDDEGKYRYINGGVLDEMYRTHMEFEKKIDYLMERAVCSDDACMLILGCTTKAQYEAILKPCTQAQFQAKTHGTKSMSEEMATLVDGTISKIVSYPAHSVKQTESLSKTRTAIKDRYVNIKNAGVTGKTQEYLNSHTKTTAKAPQRVVVANASIPVVDA